MIKKLKRWCKIRKIEHEILAVNIQKMFYGEVDTLTWWNEIQRLEKELAETKIKP